MSDSGKGRFQHWSTNMVSGISVLCRSRIPDIPDLTPVVDISDLSAFDYDFVHERQTVADHDQYLQQKSLPTCEPSPTKPHPQPVSTAALQPSTPGNSSAATTSGPGTSSPAYQIAGRISKVPNATVTQSLPAASIVSSITFRAPPPPTPQPPVATTFAIAAPVAVRHLVSGPVLQPCSTTNDQHGDPECTTSTTVGPRASSPAYQIAGRQVPNATVTRSLPAASTMSSITFRAPPPPVATTTASAFAPPVSARHLVSGQVLQPCRTNDQHVDAGPKCEGLATGEQAATDSKNRDTLKLSDIQNTAIIKDFDASGGEDPFAAAELKTINELEELSSVLWVGAPKVDSVTGQSHPTPAVTTASTAPANSVAGYAHVNQPRRLPNTIEFPYANSSAGSATLGQTGTNQPNKAVDPPPDRVIRKSISSTSVPDLTVDSGLRAQSVIDSHVSTVHPHHNPGAPNQNRICYRPPQPVGPSGMLQAGNSWSSSRFSRSFRTSGGNAPSGALLVPEQQLATDLHTWARRHGIDDARTHRVIQLSCSRSGVQQPSLSLEAAKRTLLEQLRTVAILVAERPDGAHSSVAASMWEEAAISAAVAHWDNIDQARTAATNLMRSYSTVHSMPPTTTAAAGLLNGSLGPMTGPLSRSPPTRNPSGGPIAQTPSTISDSSQVAAFKR